ncbi:MAG: hypothetical protein ACRCYP_07215, partial [Alphaproteobacteria bacterium]
KEFRGGIYLYTLDTQTPTQEVLDLILEDAYAKSETMCYFIPSLNLESLSLSLFKGANFFGDFERDDIFLSQKIKQKNFGAFYDFQKQGTLLYALTYTFPEVGLTINSFSKVENSSFYGENNEAKARQDRLDGWSFFFKAIDKTYLFSLMISGFEGVFFYQDKIVEYFVKLGAASSIGEFYNQVSLDSLRSSILRQLSYLNENNVIGSRFDCAVPPTENQNLQSQAVNNVQVSYEYLGVIRYINIILEGVI